MSHGITELDTILVPEGSKYKAWHGLEKRVEAITYREAKDAGLFPRIVEGTVTAGLAGQQVTLDDYKSLVAFTNKGKLVPLHISGNRYSIIQNEDVWKTMSEAFRGLRDDIQYKLSCAGTLCGLKRFFLSVEIGDGAGFEVNGDKFYGNLNFVTSHDGSIAFRAYDSLIRIVCNNTLNWSLEGNKNLDFKVYHKGNTTDHCKKLGQYLNAVLTGRQHFVEAMEELESLQVADTDIEPVIAGYFLNLAHGRGEKIEEFSTRTRNQIDGIAQLARHGRGNRGKTLYDVWNGVTEYYTSGDGVGKTTGLGRRAFSSEFGTGADRKEELTRYLIRGDYLNAAEEASQLLAVN